MSNLDRLADIRRQYGELSLSIEDVESSPVAQFERWFTEIIKSATADPTAMVLSTVDKMGHPDSRVVLLKGIANGNFHFYTNYKSPKSMQMHSTPFVALNFYWPHMSRQVRIKGQISKLSSKESDEYFSSRPIASQISAIASPQSELVDNRDELLQSINKLMAENFANLARPKFWGGYKVIPHEFEFWQGRDNRLHDRIQYILKNSSWELRRLAP